MTIVADVISRVPLVKNVASALARTTRPTRPIAALVTFPALRVATAERKWIAWDASVPRISIQSMYGTEAPNA